MDHTIAPPTSAGAAAGDEVVAGLRLAGTAGLSPRLAGRLVAAFGSAAAALAAPPERLAAVRGMGEARAALLAGAPSEADVRRDLDRARAASVEVLVPGAAGWPAALGDLPDPPAVLWVRGDLPQALSAAGAAGVDGGALGGRGVAIVGSRRASAFGVALAERLGAELAAFGVPVVSGLARGIDAAAHRGALSAGGRTVGVLGGGLARFYPPEHVPLARAMVERGGAVLSEFPLDMPPLPHHFPRRNRLIAALSAAVVVVEAAEGSGSLLTADHALDLGREVLAVPGRVDQPNARGVHRLLREGAALCESAADVLTTLGIPVPGAGDGGDGGDGGTPGGSGPGGVPRGATPAEQTILDALAAEERDADALLDVTGLPAGAGLAALGALELRGAVRVGGDGRYVVIRGV